MSLTLTPSLELTLITKRMRKNYQSLDWTLKQITNEQNPKLMKNLKKYFQKKK